MKSAWDFMLDDEIYDLLGEWYGDRVELQTVVGHMDKEGIRRLLDDIIEDCELFQNEEMMQRAKRARRKLR